MKKTAIILAGGLSKRLGREKASIQLAGKPLVLHVLDRVFEVVDEILVIVSSNIQMLECNALLGKQARVIVDKYETRSPLIGALTGFENAKGEYSLLLPCDTPFISSDVSARALN